MVTERRPNARWTNTDAIVTRTPITIMETSKIVADGWKMRLSGGRVPPRSLISFPPVVKVTG